GRATEKAVALDKQHACARTGGCDGRHAAGRAATDDDDIDAAGDAEFAGGLDDLGHGGIEADGHDQVSSCLRRGSSMSRSRSPTRLMPITVMKMARPGMAATHQALAM